MRKRIFIIFSVLLIMGAMFVPALAAEPRVRGNIGYSSIQFDYVDSGYTVYSWPGNVFEIGTTEFFGDFVVTSTASSVDIEFYIGSTDLTFGSSNFLLSASSSCVFSSPYENVYFSSIEVTGNVVNWNRDSINQRYIAESTPFSMNVTFDSASVVDLGSMLRNKFASKLVGGYVYLQDLEVRLKFRSDTSDAPIINCSSSVVPVQPRYSSWVNAQNTGYQIVYDDGSTFNFDWLLNSVNSVLELQITPSLTLNDIYKIVLIVGLFFWVLSLTI